jgi:hypothetical protein
VPDPPKKRTDHTIRRPTSARDAISAVKMSEELTGKIDAWAEAHGMARSDAICRLVELGLSAEQAPVAAPAEPLDLEDLAVKQISQLLDPSIPVDERERRIRRLIEGPPEFTAERIDLPKPKK